MPLLRVPEHRSECVVEYPYRYGEVVLYVQMSRLQRNQKQGCIATENGSELDSMLCRDGVESRVVGAREIGGGGFFLELFLRNHEEDISSASSKDKLQNKARRASLYIEKHFSSVGKIDPEAPINKLESQF